MILSEKTSFKMIISVFSAQNSSKQGQNRVKIGKFKTYFWKKFKNLKTAWSSEAEFLGITISKYLGHILKAGCAWHAISNLISHIYADFDLF